MDRILRACGIAPGDPGVVSSTDRAGLVIHFIDSIKVQLREQADRIDALLDIDEVRSARQ